MKLIRLLISLPLIFISVLIATGGDLWYFVGCFLGMIGGYILTRAIKHGMEGIGFALIGFPFYFYAMLPKSFDFLHEFGMDGLTVFAAKVVVVILSSIIAFIPFGNHYD
jgi:hypothetical protein